MGLNITYIAGQTAIDGEEKEGLLIQTISDHRELDEFEQKNIEQAIEWSLKLNTKVHVFTESFIKKLHQKMYGEVWGWAGSFRKTNKNIGVDKWNISTDLKYLLDDTNFWCVNKTYPPDEIAIRFKHRLVSIHCFPNGNGRHSRLMADIVIAHLFNRPVFSWGAKNNLKPEDTRAKYLSALRLADNGDYLSLIEFARS